MNEIEKQKVQVGNKTVTIRKWKGKDRKQFVKLIRDKDLINPEFMNALVYDCLDENVTLNAEEFRYVLTRIRAFTLGENIKFKFSCDKCEETFEEERELKNVLRYNYKDIKEIKVKDVIIKIGEIKNREFYQKVISENTDDVDFYDFLLRVESVNGNDMFTFEQLVEFFDDLDVDVLEEIVSIWNDGKFEIDDINQVICPHCNHKMTYIFDELPEFFPSKWFER